MKAAPISSYLNPQERSTSPPLFPSLPAARLLGIELEISQLPLVTLSNSGEFPFLLYPYLAPFNYISHADPPRHDDLLACALGQRARPRQDLAVRNLNSGEEFQINRRTSSSETSPPWRPRPPASPGKIATTQNPLKPSYQITAEPPLISGHSSPSFQEASDTAISPSSSPRRPAHRPPLCGCQEHQRRRRHQPPVRRPRRRRSEILATMVRFPFSLSSVWSGSEGSDQFT
jgi:hypothetical protein